MNHPIRSNLPRSHSDLCSIYIVIAFKCAVTPFVNAEDANSITSAHEAHININQLTTAKWKWQ